MIARAKGIYRGMTKMEAYSFKNDKGEDVNIPEKFEIKFDEPDGESRILDRAFKIDTAQVELISKLSQLKIYQEVIFEFNVEINTFRNKQDVKLRLADVIVNIQQDEKSIN